MKNTFKVGECTVIADLNGTTGKIGTIIIDPRTDTIFDRDLTLSAYNELIEFISENDHRYVLNMANEKFGA